MHFTSDLIVEDRNNALVRLLIIVSDLIQGKT